MASRLERIRIGILTTVVVSLASAAWAQDIKIGIPVGLSGANSVVAPSVVQSAELAAEEKRQGRHGDEGRPRGRRDCSGAGARRRPSTR